MVFNESNQKQNFHLQAFGSDAKDKFVNLIWVGFCLCPQINRKIIYSKAYKYHQITSMLNDRPEVLIKIFSAFIPIEMDVSKLTVFLDYCF